MITKLSIQGMSCEHCVGAIRDALSQVPVVEKVVDVNLDRAEATVEGDVASMAPSSSVYISSKKVTK